MKDSAYGKINSVNPFYLIIDKVDGCFGEKNGDKYLTLVSTYENKEGFQNTENFGIRLKIP